MEWNWVGGGTPQPSNNGANMYCDWSAYTYAPDRWFCTDEAKGEVHCGAELTMRQWNDPVWVVFQDREDDDKACAVVVDDNNWGVGVGVSVSWPPLPSIGFTWSPTGSGDNRSDNGYLFSKYVNAGGQITVKHHAQALLDFLGAVVTVTGNDEHAEASGTFTFMPNL